MKLSMLFIIATLMGGCALTSRSVKVDDADTALLNKNWAIAQELVAYDYYSWIASDSLIKYRHKLDMKNVAGWVVDKNDINTTVVFGKIKDSCLVSHFRVSFISSKPLPPVLGDTCYTQTTNAYSGFKAMTKYKAMLDKEFDSLKVPMNSYVLFHQDTILVYFFPGSTDSFSIVGGGYRGKFLRKSLDLVENVKLHQSAVLLEDAPANTTGSFRTSSMGDVINEVDIAQAIILKARLKTQIIGTKKYLYEFMYNNNTDKLEFKMMPKNK